MSSSTSIHPLSVLISHGSTLAALQREKNKTITATTVAKHPPDIVNDIRSILEKFKSAKQIGSSLETRSIIKVLGKIEAILRQLIKDDIANNEYYGKIVKEIEEYSKALTVTQNRHCYALSLSSSSTESLFGDQNYGNQSETQELNLDDAVTEILNHDGEKNCFLFCNSLFSALDSRVLIHKRDLIHWWMGMDLIVDALQGEQILAKLETKEVVQCPTKDNRYTMFRRWPFYGRPYMFAQQNRLIIAHQNRRIVEAPDSFITAINMNAYTLNAKTFEWVFQMKNVQVVHLGTWHRGLDYIVIDDMMVKNLNSLKSLKQVRFLSFQGVSRLVELPNSVYSLVKLRVLDLRACQDLQILPKGIELLQELVHLDLSQCYELRYIPKGITALSRLRVLKGFVVNAERKHNIPTSCKFNQLSKLNKLSKLTITARMVSFPERDDVETLCKMVELTTLKIHWVRNANQELEPKGGDGFGIRRFPTNLHKLELQAAPETTASRLLSLISNRTQNRLEKLYLKGGGPLNLDAQSYFFPNIKAVRFRYLHNLHVSWYHFKPCFPKLTHFQMFDCPQLIFFPTDDDGVWEET